MNLIATGRGKEVIDTLIEMATQARVAREEFILMVLRDCAMYEGDAKYDNNTTIQRAANDSIVKICTLPTNFFRYLELTEARNKVNWKPSAKPVSKSQLKRKHKEEEKMKKQAVEHAEQAKQEEEADGEPVKKKKKKKNKKKKPKKNQNTKSKSHVAKRSVCWGRQRRRGIASFYEDPNKDANRLLLLLTKYKSRHNWNHMQALNYSHPTFKNDDDESFSKHIVLKYVTRGFAKCRKYIDEKVPKGRMDVVTSKVINHIGVLEEVKNLSSEKPQDVDRMLELLNKYSVREVHQDFAFAVPGQNDAPVNHDNRKAAFQLCREHLPTGFQKLHSVGFERIDFLFLSITPNINKLFFYINGRFSNVQNSIRYIKVCI